MTTMHQTTDGRLRSWWGGTLWQLRSWRWTGHQQLDV